ncbi:MAG: polymer-forming cytoskeletal protein, partial [Treponema sp.]|nr:polymer-forming cytoskeletal protein [Treponema sp.]
MFLCSSLWSAIYVYGTGNYNDAATTGWWLYSSGPFDYPEVMTSGGVTYQPGASIDELGNSNNQLYICEPITINNWNPTNTTQVTVYLTGGQQLTFVGGNNHIPGNFNLYSGGITNAGSVEFSDYHDNAGGTITNNGNLVFNQNLGINGTINENNAGNITVNGNLTNNGNINTSGNISASGTITNNKTLNVTGGTVSSDGAFTNTETGSVNVTGTGDINAPIINNGNLVTENDLSGDIGGSGTTVDYSAARTYYWKGGASGAWNAAGNWSYAADGSDTAVRVPGNNADDVVWISSDVEITLASDVTILTLYIQNSVTLDLGTNTLNLLNPVYDFATKDEDWFKGALHVGRDGVSGKLTVKGSSGSLQMDILDEEEAAQNRLIIEEGNTVTVRGHMWGDANTNTKALSLEGSGNFVAPSNLVFGSGGYSGIFLDSSLNVTDTNNIFTFTWSPTAGSSDWTDNANWQNSRAPSWNVSVSIPESTNAPEFTGAADYSSQFKDISVGTGGQFTVSSAITADSVSSDGELVLRVPSAISSLSVSGKLTLNTSEGDWTFKNTNGFDLTIGNLKLQGGKVITLDGSENKITVENGLEVDGSTKLVVIGDVDLPGKTGFGGITVGDGTTASSLNFTGTADVSTVSVDIKANGKLSANSGTMTVSGAWNNEAGNTGFAAGTGTVAFTSATTEINGTNTFNNLNLSAATTSAVVKGPLTVNGTLTATSGKTIFKDSVDLSNVTGFVHNDGEIFFISSASKKSVVKAGLDFYKVSVCGNVELELKGATTAEYFSLDWPENNSDYYQTSDFTSSVTGDSGSLTISGWTNGDGVNLGVLLSRSSAGTGNEDVKGTLNFNVPVTVTGGLVETHSGTKLQISKSLSGINYRHSASSGNPNSKIDVAGTFTLTGELNLNNWVGTPEITVEEGAVLNVARIYKSSDAVAFSNTDSTYSIINNGTINISREFTLPANYKYTGDGTVHLNAASNAVVLNNGNSDELALKTLKITGGNLVTLNATAAVSAENLTLTAEPSLTVTGTVKLPATTGFGDLSAGNGETAGDIIFTGSEDASVGSVTFANAASSFTGTSGNLFVNGDWINTKGGTYTANNGTVNFTGDTTVSGSTDFYDVIFDGTAAIPGSNSFHDVTFTGATDLDGNNTFNDVTFTGTANLAGDNTFNDATFSETATLGGVNTFASLTATGLGGKTLTVNDKQTVSGDLLLSGTSASSRFTIAGNGSFALSSDQTSGQYLILAENAPVITDGTTAGNHSYFASNSILADGASLPAGWVLSDGTVWYWTGAESTEWANANNWLPKSVPASAATTTIYIESNAENRYPVLDTTVTVKNIQMSDGTGLTVSSEKTLTSTAASVLAGTVIGKIVSTNGFTTAGDLVLSGAVLTGDVTSGNIIISDSSSIGVLTATGTVEVAESTVGNLTASGSVTVTDSTVGGFILSDDAVTLSTTTVTSSVSSDASITITNNSIISGAVTSDDEILISDSSSVTGNVTANSVSISEGSSVTGNIDAANEVSVSASTVTGDISDTAELKITTSTINGDISTAGAITLSGTVSHNGNLTNTTGSVSVTGDYTLTGDISSENAVLISGSFHHSGTSDDWTADSTVDAILKFTGTNSQIFEANSSCKYKVLIEKTSGAITYSKAVVFNSYDAGTSKFNTIFGTDCGSFGGVDSIILPENVTNNSTELTFDCDILVSGNFTDSGKIANNDTNGTIILDGSSDQTFTSSAASSYYGIKVNSSAEVTFETEVNTGSLILASGTAAFEDNVTVSSVTFQTSSAILVAGDSSLITVSGNWDNTEGGTFTANESTVQFTGDTTVSGSTDFYDVIFDGTAAIPATNNFHDVTFTGTADLDGDNIFNDVSFAADADLSGDNTFNNATFSETATLGGANNFASLTATGLGGKTLTVNGKQTISGALSLSGTSAESLLTVNGTGSFAITSNQDSGNYLSVAADGPVITNVSGTTAANTYFANNSKSSNGSDLSARGWLISDGNMWIWQGTTSNAWATAANWLPKSVPASNTTIVIKIPVVAAPAKYPVLSENASVGTLIMESGTALTVADEKSLTVIESLTLPNVSLSGKITDAAGITVNGNITQTGAVTLNGAVEFNTSDISGDYEFTVTGDAVNNGELTAENTFTVTGSFTAGTDSKFSGTELKISGNIDDSNSDTTDGFAGTIHFTGNSAQDFIPKTGRAYSLIVDCDDTVTVSSSVNCSSLEILKGTIKFTDDVSIAEYTDTETSTGSIIFEKSVTFEEDSVTVNTSGNISVGENLTAAGSVNLNNIEIACAEDSTVSISGNSVTIRGTILPTLNGKQNLSITAATGSVTVGSAAAVTIGSAEKQFKNISILATAQDISFDDKVTLNSTGTTSVTGKSISLTDFAVTNSLEVTTTGKLTIDGLSAGTFTVNGTPSAAQFSKTITVTAAGLSINYPVTVTGDTTESAASFNVAGDFELTEDGSIIPDTTDSYELQFTATGNIILNKAPGSATKKFKKVVFNNSTDFAAENLTVYALTTEFAGDSTVVSGNAFAVSDDLITSGSEVNYQKAVTVGNTLTIEADSNFDEIVTVGGDLIITADADFTKAVSVGKDLTVSGDDGDATFTTGVTVTGNFSDSGKAFAGTITMNGAEDKEFTAVTDRSYAVNLQKTDSSVLTFTNNVTLASITTDESSYESSLNFAEGGNLAGATTFNCDVALTGTLIASGGIIFADGADLTAGENAVIDGAVTFNSVIVSGKALETGAITIPEAKTTTFENIITTSSINNNGKLILKNTVSSTGFINNGELSVEGSDSVPSVISGSGTFTNASTGSITGTAAELHIQTNFTDLGSVGSDVVLIFDGSVAQTFTPTVNKYASIEVNKADENLFTVDGSLAAVNLALTDGSVQFNGDVTVDNAVNFETTDEILVSGGNSSVPKTITAPSIKTAGSIRSTDDADEENVAGRASFLKLNSTSGNIEIGGSIGSEDNYYNTVILSAAGNDITVSGSVYTSNISVNCKNVTFENLIYVGGVDITATDVVSINGLKAQSLTISPSAQHIRMGGIINLTDASKDFIINFPLEIIDSTIPDSDFDAYLNIAGNIYVRNSTTPAKTGSINAYGEGNRSIQLKAGTGKVIQIENGESTSAGIGNIVGFDVVQIDSSLTLNEATNFITETLRFAGSGVTVGAGDLILTGSLENTGSVTYSGDVFVTGNITNSGTVTAEGDISLTGDLTDTGTWNQTADKAIIFNGSEAQNFNVKDSTEYADVEINKISGNFTVSAADDLFKASNFTITKASAVTFESDVELGAITSAASGTINFLGNTTIKSDTTLATSGKVTFASDKTHLFNDDTNNTSLTHTAGETEIDGELTAADISLASVTLNADIIASGSLLITDDISVQKAVELTAGSINLGSSETDTITISGTPQLTLSSAVTNNSTLTLSGATDIVVTGDFINAEGASISGTSDSAVFTFKSDVTDNGSWTSKAAVTLDGNSTTGRLEQNFTPSNSSTYNSITVNKTEENASVIFAGDSNTLNCSTITIKQDSATIFEGPVNIISYIEENDHTGTVTFEKGGSIAGAVEFKTSGLVTIGGSGDSFELKSGSTYQSLTHTAGETVITAKVACGAGSFDNLSLTDSTAELICAENKSLSVSGDLNNAGSISVTGTGTLLVTGEIVNGGTVTLGSGNATFSGNYTAASGSSLIASSGITIFEGNVDLTDSTFTANGGTVQINPSSEPAVIFGNVTFNDVLISGSANITGSNTYNNLTVTTVDGEGLGGKSILFTAGTTQTVNGILTMKGSSEDNLLTVKASTDSYWNLICTSNTGHAVEYIDLKYSDNKTAAGALTAENSTDSGFNKNWFFPGQAYIWAGSTTDHKNDWFTAANWIPVSIPGIGAKVTVPAGKTDYP